MVHLFAALPAVDGERVEVKRIHNCRRFVLFDIAKFSQPHVTFECTW
jgi:pescadillo protein